MHEAVPQRKTEAASRSIPPQATEPLALLCVAVANVALAFGPWFVRVADTGPVASAFWRITLAAPLICVMALASGARPQRLGAGLWITLALAGIAFAADLGSWHMGILRTTLANATLFGNCAVLIFPLYGFLVARRWPARGQAYALLLALAGGVLLMGRSYDLDARNLAGDLLCLSAGILYTVYFILMTHARRVMAPLSSLALSTLASILPLLGFALLLGERVMPQHWTPLIGLALASQVLGQGCMIYALGRLSPLVIGIALLIQPMVAGAIGWIVYGERLGAPDLMGAALVAAALVMVARRPAVAPVAADAHVQG
jgi:drug/metabolite transporter (DMT)-like permease